MRTINAALGTVSLVGAVCCSATAFFTPVKWAWAGWTGGAV